MNRKLLGILLIVIGIFFFIEEIVPYRNWEGFGILWLIALGLIFAYKSQGSLGFLIGGTITGAVGVFVFTQDVLRLVRYDSSIFFLLLGIAFYIIYSMGTKPNQWPLYPAAGLMGFSLFTFLSEVHPRYGKYVFPLALIIIGLGIMRNSSQK